MTALSCLPALEDLNASNNELISLPVQGMLQQLIFLTEVDVNGNPFGRLPKQHPTAKKFATYISSKFRSRYENSTAPDYERWEKEDKERFALAPATAATAAK